MLGINIDALTYMMLVADHEISARSGFTTNSKPGCAMEHL